MPGKNIEPGKYGARGIKGGEALARQLDRLTSFFATPVTSARGLIARLNYLTSSARTREAARQAGFDPSKRQLKNWFEGKQNPNKANLQRIENAYRALRRQNVASHLLRRLNNGGRGTRIEIHPASEAAVTEGRRRSPDVRTLNVRKWDRIIHAWAYGTADDLHNAWIDLAEDLGSDWGAYEYVTNVGFAA